MILVVGMILGQGHNERKMNSTILQYVKVSVHICFGKSRGTSSSTFQWHRIVVTKNITFLIAIFHFKCIPEYYEYISTGDVVYIMYCITAYFTAEYIEQLQQLQRTLHVLENWLRPVS